MTEPICCDPTKRHDFVLLFDVADGNPNGDPDAGNLPRVDPETMQGLVTDVALKRKVRDWVDTARGAEERFKIYVQSGEALNAKHRRAYESNGLPARSKRSEDIDTARNWMCREFFDVRFFGALMSTGDHNCGQVRGPAQLVFARSVNPIFQLESAITRQTVTREGEDKDREMGRKATVPYGLYRSYGFFNPHLAVKTGADAEDLGLFWQALQMMWDLDRSAARGLMGCQGLYVFTHESPLGNAPAHRLFERVQVTCRPETSAPRSFADYAVTVDESDLPAGVTLTRLVG